LLDTSEVSYLIIKFILV